MPAASTAAASAALRQQRNSSGRHPPGCSRPYPACPYQLRRAARAPFGSTHRARENRGSGLGHPRRLGTTRKLRNLKSPGPDADQLPR
jgi:hypothetical protein